MWSSFKTINHLVHKRIPYKIHSLQTHCMMRVLEKLVYNRYIIFINHTPTHTYFLCLYSICEYMIFKKEKIQTTQFFLVKSKLSTTKKCKTATFSRIFFKVPFLLFRHSKTVDMVAKKEDQAAVQLQTRRIFLPPWTQPTWVHPEQLPTVRHAKA